MMKHTYSSHSKRRLSAFQKLYKLVSQLIRQIPDPIRYILTIIAFWPTVIYHRLFCYFFPEKRQLWNYITPNVILGSVLVRDSEIHQLAKVENVRGVVNLCREWNESEELYNSLNVRQLYLPTIDFDAPTIENALKGAHFIADCVSRNETVYVHCKAGRGRSTCVVLAYLVVFCSLSPQEADALIREKRPNISKKWHLPLFSDPENGLVARAEFERKRFLASGRRLPSIVSASQ